MKITKEVKKVLDAQKIILEATSKVDKELTGDSIETAYLAVMIIGSLLVKYCGIDVLKSYVNEIEALGIKSEEIQTYDADAETFDGLKKTA